MPALIRKFHEAKINNDSVVEVWGTGKPLREFLYVDDMADACVFLLENYNGDEHVNVGTGKELTIGQLAEMVANVVGFSGTLEFNSDKPDGTPRKLLDVSKLYGLGWTYGVELKDGISRSYDWYKENNLD